jgi:hypothetical protein
MVRSELLVLFKVPARPGHRTASVCLLITEQPVNNVIGYAHSFISGRGFIHGTDISLPHTLMAQQ